MCGAACDARTAGLPRATCACAGSIARLTLTAWNASSRTSFCMVPCPRSTCRQQTAGCAAAGDRPCTCRLLQQQLAGAADIEAPQLQSATLAPGPHPHVDVVRLQPGQGLLHNLVQVAAADVKGGRRSLGEPRPELRGRAVASAARRAAARLAPAPASACWTCRRVLHTFTDSRQGRALLQTTTCFRSMPPLFMALPTAGPQHGQRAGHRPLELRRQAQRTEPLVVAASVYGHISSSAGLWPQEPCGVAAPGAECRQPGQLLRVMILQGAQKWAVEMALTPPLSAACSACTPTCMRMDGVMRRSQRDALRTGSGQARASSEGPGP